MALPYTMFAGVTIDKIAAVINFKELFETPSVAKTIDVYREKTPGTMRGPWS